MPELTRVIDPRLHVSVPGRLRAALVVRMKEVKSLSFSKFVIELIAFDLRRRKPHLITGPIALQSAAVQEAIDRLIVLHYIPGLAEIGGFLEALLKNRIDSAPRGNVPAQVIVCLKKHVHLPASLHEEVLIRIEELGFTWASEYITSLLRFDLLCAGHLYFPGDRHYTRQQLKELDAWTKKAFHDARRNPIVTLPERLADEAAGRTLTQWERRRALTEAWRRLREAAVARFQ
jgi:hypothetical protein